MTPLLSVDEALQRIQSKIPVLLAEFVALEHALGRILATDVFASENIPPFPNSSMDGFAVRSEDTQPANDKNPISLQVVMDIPAGTSPTRTLLRGQTARIMTGAPLPDGADAVVPVEDTNAQWTPGINAGLPPQVDIHRSVKAGDYVRLAGEDVKSGERIIQAGTVLRAAEIGLLAAIGKSPVEVIRRPRVAIISTGDELVDIGEKLTTGKIRDSNSYTLAALVTEQGGIPIRIPKAQDTLDDVRKRFNEALAEKPDLIISSAGVSVGAFDVVRTIIDELGKVDFWRINLRPGKPLAFGQIGDVPFFGLPGNPVSAMVTFDVFVRPALLKTSQHSQTTPMIKARTVEDIQSDGRRSYIRVKLTRDGDSNEWIASLTGNQSSGVLRSMMLADGLMIIPEDVHFLSAGSSVGVRVLRNLEETD